MIRTFLFTGDSNAVGFGMSQATLPPDLASFDFGKTYIFTQTSTYWGQLTPGVNTGLNGAWGPEVKFAQLLRSAFPEDTFLIIKVAKGSTPVDDITGLDWNPLSGGEMFDLTTQTLSRARAAMAPGKEMPNPEATFIVGGTNDAYDAERAASFKDNLSLLISDARVYWGSEEIFLNRMLDVGPHSLEVRVAQWELDQADIGVYSFKTIGYSTQADGIHYDATGYVQLGQGFFDTFMAA